MSTILPRNKATENWTTNDLDLAVLVIADEKIHFNSTTALKLLKLPIARIKKGMSLRELPFFDDEEARVFIKLCQKALKSKNNEETYLKLKHGTFRALLGKIKHANKAAIRAVFFPTNKIEDANNPDKDLLSKISANSPDVIFKLDLFPKLRLDFISDQCESALGYSKEELYKHPAYLERYLHGEDKKMRFVPGKKLPNGQEIKDIKVQIHLHKNNGEVKFLEVVLNPLLNSKKEVQGVIGNIRDITDRLLTEELLVDAKSKFDLITTLGNDIITFFTYLPKERYIYVSPNIEKILGFKPEQLLNEPGFFLKRLSQDKDVFEKGEAVMAEFQRKGEGRSYKHIYKTTNSKGKTVWLENSSTPIRNTKGKIGFYLNILKDVTEEQSKEQEIQKQYVSYLELLENSPAAYIVHDKGVVEYCNPRAQQLLRAKTREEIVGQNALEFFVGESQERVQKRIREIYEHKNLNKFNTYHIRDFEKNTIEVEIKSVFIKFQNKDLVLSLINNLSLEKVFEKEKQQMRATASQNIELEKEIKERMEAEKNLIEKTAHLSSIFESSTHLIWTVDRAYRVTSFNENFSRVLKQQHGIDVLIGDKIDEKLRLRKEEYAEYWYPVYDEAFKGKKLEFEKKDYIEERGEVHRRVFINPIFDDKRKINEISCIANDITDSKLYEKKLVNQTAKLTAIFDSSHHYIWTIDRQERLTSFNKNYFDIISSLYNTKPYLGLVLNRGILSHDNDYNKLLKHHYKIAFEGKATSFEVEILNKHNKKVHLEVFLNPIFEKDRVVEVSGIAHNITEKKQAQQKIELSLKEKEILLREVHHRVKNNMQVVSSILNLQSSYVSDEYALALLKESQNRIKTMAIIHESLYQNKSFSSVNFSEYVRTLISNIIHSYSYSREKISMALNLEEVILPLDTSIPAGLIINELVTNAIKHAFPGLRQGTISLDLKTQENFVFLALKDDGVGFAENKSFQNSNSLGLQLVNTLIEQIDGKYEFDSTKDSGTEVKITFKM